jgi:hypothetical protein
MVTAVVLRGDTDLELETCPVPVVAIYGTYRLLVNW